MADSGDLFDRAVAYQEQGALREAEHLYRQILQNQPARGEVYSNLGVILATTKRPEEASACFARAVVCDPFQADAHNNLGVALREQGDLDGAVNSFREALRLNPQHVSALYNLGNAFTDTKHLSQAVECFRQALTLNPNYSDAAFNLGNVLKDLGQRDEAIACYLQALSLNGTDARIHNNLGNALKEKGAVGEAMDSYRRALRLNPGHLNAHINLGEALKDLGQFVGALEQFEVALRLEPGHPIAHLNRGFVRLLQGDFERGWRDYEYRLAVGDMALRSYSEPRWHGEPLDGKTILLHAEQGLGDTVQFIRYAPLVKKRGGTVLVECQPSLLGLLSTVAGVEDLIPAGGQLPPFDAQASLASLPGIFGTAASTIPADVPYLTADRDLIKKWRLQLEAIEGLKIGIVWQGNPQFRADAQRSIPLISFGTLADVTAGKLISLQVGSGTEQLTTARFDVLNLAEHFDRSSLSDLAAVLMNLDLVVTADTAVAHIAGALGMPVWLPLPFVPDWRWQLEREDSPWYPTMRLFRQKAPGDWGEVFQRLAREVIVRFQAHTMPPGSQGSR